MKTQHNPSVLTRWLSAACVATALAVIGCGGSGSSGTLTSTATATTATGSTGATNPFVQASLVSDVAGSAPATDPNLKNPWGVSMAPGGAFWVSDNDTGLVTLYNGATGAAQSLVVTVPTASGSGTAKVTGQVYNATSSFAIPNVGPAAFIFASEDGSLSAWGGGSAATLVANRSTAGALYTGLALASNGGANFLYAANFASGQIDVFNTNYALTTSFTDPAIPSGFAPYNVQTIGGNLVVTFAKQNPTKTGAVAGVGNGYVDVFNPNGSVMAQLVATGQLNAPWGLALAPAGFGSFGGDLLVGNLGDGTIHAYNMTSGQSIGELTLSSGQPFSVSGLWSLFFGTGGAGGSASTLYYTAGINGYADGVIGTLTPSTTPASLHVTGTKAPVH